MGTLRYGRITRLQKLCASDPKVTEALRVYVTTVQRQGVQSFLLDGQGSQNVIYHDRPKRELCQAMKQALIAGGKREGSARIMAQKIFAGIYDGVQKTLAARQGLYDLEAQARDLNKQIEHRKAMIENPLEKVFGLS